MVAESAILKLKGSQELWHQFEFHQVQLNCQIKIIEANWPVFVHLDEEVPTVLDPKAQVQGIMGVANWLHDLPANADRHSKARIP